MLSTISNALSNTFTARFASTVAITFKSNNWGPTEFNVPEGEVLAKYVLDQSMPNLKMSCGGDAICGRCRLNLEEELFNKLKESQPITEDEDDTLDSDERTPTTRLGCQLKVTKEFEGATITIPSE
ncbi:2Fe-2S Ferredoxin [Carpediemonas membranifera]|uniref:2Fe-2S Ferredoxin n=1 Tax=Carpediemonas membranifera TaxID=201153 RepID=A0A8J6BUI1_9EUKA|nr:2Fe-2S Ferredoxin [Carpediemonas membranifera]|eukprot:KAG9390381.1 2Fe-2S Ferredoxin [Carpediemonas membranifera]